MKWRRRKRKKNKNRHQKRKWDKQCLQKWQIS